MPRSGSRRPSRHQRASACNYHHASAHLCIVQARGGRVRLRSGGRQLERRRGELLSRVRSAGLRRQQPLCEPGHLSGFSHSMRQRMRFAG